MARELVLNTSELVLDRLKDLGKSGYGRGGLVHKDRWGVQFTVRKPAGKSDHRTAGESTRIANQRPEVGGHMTRHDVGRRAVDARQGLERGPDPGRFVALPPVGHGRKEGRVR